MDLKLLVALIFGVLLGVQNVHSLDNGLALTPPMGWMTWQRFRCTIDCVKYPRECINEALIKRTVDTIVSHGYKDAGYEYVVIDDCWLEKERDPVTKKLVADRYRFPNGMKAIGDYIRSKGLKFGLYEDYGTHTCEGYPGVIDHMELDANTFAEWGVDYVKLDGCYADENSMEEGYPLFGKYLNATNRPMVYSCSWPAYIGDKANFSLIAKHCNLWRNYGDIDDSYRVTKVIANHFAEKQDTYLKHAGPGAWNDPDMLLIGNFGLSLDQSKLQMAIWSVLAAPLLMSADMDTIRPEFRDILLNRDAIAINQDRMGTPGRRIYDKNDQQVWLRFLDGGSMAVALVNHRTDGMPVLMSFEPNTMGINKAERYSVKNIFEPAQLHSDYFPHSNVTLYYRVNISGCVFLRFDPAN